MTINPNAFTYQMPGHYLNGTPIRPSATTPNLFDAEHRSTPRPEPEYQWDIIVIGCSANKTNEPARAEDLYTGSFFTHAYRAANALRTQTRHIAILSALHGLIDPTSNIAPYDTKLGDTGSINSWTIGDTIDTWAETHPISRCPKILALTTTAYTTLLLKHWTNVDTPLAKAGGIGHMRHRLSVIASTRTVPPFTPNRAASQNGPTVTVR